MHNELNHCTLPLVNILCEEKFPAHAQITTVTVEQKYGSGINPINPTRLCLALLVGYNKDIVGVAIKDLT